MTAALLHILRGRVAREWAELIRINPKSRPWHLPLAAALSSGLPLFVGVYFGHIGYGLVSGLGGMTFLYMPPTRLGHRMIMLLSVTAMMAASFFTGLLAHFFPLLLVPVVTVLTLLVTMLCRYFKVAPPGSLFFLMSAMIAAFMPHTVEQIPLYVGLVFLGGLLACVIGFLYSLFVFWRGTEPRALAAPETDVKIVVVDALIISAMTGLSLLAAQLLQMPRPYWVPVACIAVMQGVTFRSVWNKQIHRIIGTAAGLAVSWVLLSLHPQGWWLCLTMMALNFIIELLIVRHYASAVVFITPLTIFLAEAGSGVPMVREMAAELVASRFWDTVLGCAFGLTGAIGLHYTGLRDYLARVILRIYEKGRQA